jgi:sugar phosphate isomerase/epimerase
MQWIPCEACNLFFPGSLRLTGPEVDAHKIHAYLELSLKRAEMIGAKVIVFGSGGARNVPDAFPKERAWVQLVEMLHIAGPIAASHGIFISIEPLRSQECNLINTAAEGFSLARLVDHPNVGLLLDIYHMVAEGEDFGIASTARSLLGHAHFAEPRQRAFPLAADPTTRAFIDALRRADYREAQPGG